jgi:hypothetical protein
MSVAQWDPAFGSRNGIFRDLNSLCRFAGFTDFPSHSALNEMLAAYIEKTLQRPGFRFVEEIPNSGLCFEQRIFQSAEVPTRRNWHDLFGAISWWLFPRSKAAINLQHVEDLSSEGKSRSPRRDRLTHFDECGLLLLHCSPELVAELRSHRWKEAMVSRRNEWDITVRPFVFGHAIYEKALSPYIGLTAKFAPIEIEPDFFCLSLREQYEEIDRRLAERILSTNPFDQPGFLSPLPVLGIPGYCEANHDPMFYGNRQYFRPRPT